MTDQEQRVMDRAGAILGVFQDGDTALEKRVALEVAAAALHLALGDEEDDECPDCGEFHGVSN